jgi:hypothetical protein
VKRAVRPRRVWALAIGISGALLGPLMLLVAWLLFRGETYVVPAMALAFTVGAGIGTYFAKPVWDDYVKKKLETAPADPGWEWVDSLRVEVLKRRTYGERSHLVQLVGPPQAIDVGVWERVSSEGRSRIKVGTAVRPWSSITAEWDRARGRLVVLGEPGYGKTVAALTLLKHINETGDEPRPIAELFPLVEWPRWPEQHEAELAGWLAAELSGSYGITEASARRLIDAQRVVPLFDGLDEVPDETRGECRTAIEGYAGRAPPFRPFVVTCRSKEYADLAPDWVAADREVILIGLEPEQTRRPARRRRWRRAPARRRRRREWAASAAKPSCAAPGASVSALPSSLEANPIHPGRTDQAGNPGVGVYWR